MQYDFDQVVDRSKNLSAKYDERVKKFGTDDVIWLSRAITVRSWQFLSEKSPYQEVS